MAEITRFLGMSMGFCEDYTANAHVHIHYHPYNCTINADNFTIHSGSLPPRVAALALEWVMLNNEAIKRNWNVYKTGGTNVSVIPPLVA